MSEETIIDNLELYAPERIVVMRTPRDERKKQTYTNIRTALIDITSEVQNSQRFHTETVILFCSGVAITETAYYEIAGTIPANI